MIRGHSINLLQIFDVPQKFKVMSLIVETIKRTAADQKRSCGYAPHIQMPIYPDFDDNTMVMDENEPSSVQAQAKREKPRTEKAAKMPRCQPLMRHLNIF